MALLSILEKSVSGPPPELVGRDSILSQTDVILEEDSQPPNETKAATSLSDWALETESREDIWNVAPPMH